MNNFLKTAIYRSIEHAVKVAVFIAMSAFLGSLLDQHVAQLIFKSQSDAVVVVLINALIAGALKYINTKKNEVTVEKLKA